MADDVQISALTTADIEPVRQLADRVWRKHYPSIISAAQIDYMLAQRYAHDVIAAELNSGEVWWHKAAKADRLLGFSACVLTERPYELKLDKLYVDNEAQRSGVGARLIGNALAIAAKLGKRYLILAVNKNNTQAINAYRKAGFTVREAIVKDIGEGFIMDDFIMVKQIEK